MRRLLMAAFLGLSFGLGCAEAACSASATRGWTNGVTIEAFASGPTCAQAVTTITLRNRSGAAIWTRAHIATDLLNFSQDPTADGKVMTAKLKDWISGDGFMKSVDRLVTEGEFHFTPSEDIDKTTFEKYRKAKLPVFCYIQGMESGNCLAVGKEGIIIELGIQSFPG
jgi:hypothetical protein